MWRFCAAGKQINARERVSQLHGPSCFHKAWFVFAYSEIGALSVGSKMGREDFRACEIKFRKSFKTCGCISPLINLLQDSVWEVQGVCECVGKVCIKKGEKIIFVYRKCEEKRTVFCEVWVLKHTFKVQMLAPIVSQCSSFTQMFDILTFFVHIHKVERVFFFCQF